MGTDAGASSGPDLVLACARAASEGGVGGSSEVDAGYENHNGAKINNQRKRGAQNARPLDTAGR